MGIGKKTLLLTPFFPSKNECLPKLWKQGFWLRGRLKITWFIYVCLFVCFNLLTVPYSRGNAITLKLCSGSVSSGACWVLQWWHKEAHCANCPSNGYASTHSCWGDWGIRAQTSRVDLGCPSPRRLQEWKLPARVPLNIVLQPHLPSAVLPLVAFLSHCWGTGISPPHLLHPPAPPIVAHSCRFVPEESWDVLCSP